MDFWAVLSVLGIGWVAYVTARDYINRRINRMIREAVAADRAKRAAEDAAAHARRRARADWQRDLDAWRERRRALKNPGPRTRQLLGPLLDRMLTEMPPRPLPPHMRDAG